jgi:alkanesulfonate monooxygenase SsuD/methylene tetrahydromethanopterin reductase-like flavin-dependent oxidoreductase (luciferase family)
MLERALELYREQFQPSASLSKPYTMVAVNLIAAETDEEAELLFTSMLQLFIALRFGKPGPLPPPRQNLSSEVHPVHLEAARGALAYSAVGSAAKVEKTLQTILDHTQADELILTGHIYDHQARLRSFEIGAQVCNSMSTSVV